MWHVWQLFVKTWETPHGNAPWIAGVPLPVLPVVPGFVIVGLPVLDMPLVPV
jgi:hypothetical protein